MHKKHGYQPTSTITTQPPKGGSSVSRDFDSYEKLAFDMLNFMRSYFAKQLFVSARGSSKTDPITRFTLRYAKLKGWL